MPIVHKPSDGIDINYLLAYWSAFVELSAK